MAVKIIKIPTSDRWYATWCVGQRSYRISTRTKDRRQADRIGHEIEASLAPSDDAKAVARISGRAYAQALYVKLRSRQHSPKQRHACFIDADHIHKLLLASGGRCAVSGLPLSFERPSGSTRNPWAPSLDRIDARRPYEVGNVRVVCVAANIAMLDWGYGVLLRLAEGVTVHSSAKRAQESEIVLTPEMAYHTLPTSNLGVWR